MPRTAHQGHGSRAHTARKAAAAHRRRPAQGGRESRRALTVTINQTTISNPTVYGFEAAGGTIDATITNTLIASTGASAVIGLAGSPQINVDSSSVVDSTIAFHAASASTVIRISNNNIYNDETEFVIASGGAIETASNNRVTPGGSTKPSAKIT